jgi:hypothetical protein
MFGKSNKVADALSPRIMMLDTLSVEFVGLECMKELYVEDVDFAKAWKAYKVPWSIDRTPYLDFHIQEGLLFKNQGLCIPQSSLWMNLIRVA